MNWKNPNNNPFDLVCFVAEYRRRFRDKHSKAMTAIKTNDELYQYIEENALWENLNALKKNRK